VKRQVKNTITGSSETQDVPIPIAVEKYNLYMGGVNKSDQYISYNRVLRKTVRYWMTSLYHLLEIIATNSSIPYNWCRMESQLKRVTQTEFRDRLVQEIIETYGRRAIDPEDFAIAHGSQFRSDAIKRKCAYCHSNQTKRYCPDCPHNPSLCQVSERDCHTIWHHNSSFRVRKQWFKNQTRTTGNRTSLAQLPTERRERPTGSSNLKKRRGKYRIH
jgi:hypothetical protein